MKRDILFKGKRVDTNEWIQGFLLKDRELGFYITEGIGANGEEVHPDTVCQFTGMLDKNGNKIFDGDITDEGIIVFHEEYLGFFVKETDDDYNPLYDKVFVEITGNIHDETH